MAARNTKTSGAKLPAPFPKLPDDRAGLFDWAGKATRHQILDTYRPGRHEHAGLVIRLAGGHELFFETVAEASRPERFATAFMGIDGVVMESWSAQQTKHIVGALVRAARIGPERDERETFTDLGGRYLRGCVFAGNVLRELKMDTTEGAYRGAAALQEHTRRLRGDPGERWPEVLYAVDQQAIYVVRGLFLAHSKTAVGRMNAATFNQQMRRVGWVDVELHPRKPGAPKATRPHLRCWRIPEGWDDVWASNPAPEPNDPDGPVVPHGPASTRARATRGRVSSARAHAGPRDQATTPWKQT